MTATVVESPFRASGVGKRFRRGWALRDCTFALRPATVTALVGPNGAGKSTLMSAAAGLQQLTEGAIEINGTAAVTVRPHPDLGYLAQDKPLYRQLRVDDMLDIARHLNRRWDSALARRLVDEAGLPPTAKVRTLSGGQRTRLALALVLARRPSVLLLDEPLADLDPLARREVQQTLLTETMDTGMTVLMSSHILGEIEDVCEDLLVLRDGRITLAGALEDLLARHRVLIGPASGADDLPWLPTDAVLEASRTSRQTTVLISRPVVDLPTGWTSETPTLDELVIGYLRTGRTETQPPVDDLDGVTR